MSPVLSHRRLRAGANAVLPIEQRLLPHQFKIIRIRDFADTARAIKDMVGRGAGAIGATAAYGLAQAPVRFVAQISPASSNT